MMRKYFSILLATTVTFGASAVVAEQSTDILDVQNYFIKKFPGVKKADFINGPYALDENKRLQWEAMEEFPPYEDFVEKGRAIWEKPFANGKGFTDCFGDVTTVRAKYPHWDSEKAEVVTLEGDLNKCLTDNGEKPLKWKKGPMAQLSAYVGYEGRGQKINVVVPDDPKAKAAYEEGKQFFYAKRGQLNLACADCHVYYAGSFVRGNLLSPLLGHTTHFPVFRAKWQKADKDGDGLGTLHRRYGGCNKQVRAKPFKAQGREYRNLEFFHTSMSNGLEINAPGYRE